MSTAAGVSPPTVGLRPGGGQDDSPDREQQGDAQEAQGVVQGEEDHPVRRRPPGGQGACARAAGSAHGVGLAVAPPRWRARPGPGRARTRGGGAGPGGPEARVSGGGSGRAGGPPGRSRERQGSWGVDRRLDALTLRTVTWATSPGSARLLAAPLVVAANGGAAAAWALGRAPDVVVGDACDSLAPQTRAALAGAGDAFEVAPREKDETDLELALRAAVGRGVAHRQAGRRAGAGRQTGRG